MIPWLARPRLVRYARLMVDLYSLVYSPWSEKARWALDHHRIAYRRVRYEPVIGESNYDFSGAGRK